MSEKRLPIVNDWQCCGRADCCRESPAIRMSLQEAALLQDRALGRVLVWKPAQPYGFVELQAKPCPFLSGNTCTVYEVRPYKCRQFLCFRPDGEPYDESRTRRRMDEDRGTRRVYAMNQRKAGKWALRHGWAGTEP